MFGWPSVVWREMEILWVLISPLGGLFFCRHIWTAINTKWMFLAHAENRLDFLGILAPYISIADKQIHVQLERSAEMLPLLAKHLGITGQPWFTFGKWSWKWCLCVFGICCLSGMVSGYGEQVWNARRLPDTAVTFSAKSFRYYYCSTYQVGYVMCSFILTICHS